MLVPLKWLNDYVKVDDINSGAFDDAMTMSGSKVEEVIEAGREISNVVTGRIVKIEKHPDADRLLICQIDTGDGTVQIVTGASNVSEGDIVPAALNGAALPGGIRIKKGKLRGVESNGMLCSAEELKIDVPEAIHGIHILPSDTPVGADVKAILGLDSVIVDFEITPNRPDCLSMIGIAREVSVTFGRDLKLPEVMVKENNKNIKDYIDVEIQAKDLCTRYAARIAENVQIKESPDWMKKRLTEAGVRPINNIVDITNYVMLEYGQPLHAFDYDKISGKKIIVRRADENEKLTTLDGKERILKNSMLVIADCEKSLVVAGVMGGEDSEVTEDTRTILLESACFNGTSVRLTSKELGFRTEASSRFEKGVEVNLAVEALNRAAQLIVELGAGEVMEGIVDRYEDKLEPWTIDISPERINKFLGTEIPAEQMIKILQRLGVKIIGGDVLKALIPTFRGDLELEVDIAEEIARIYGYNNIKPTVIKGEALQGARSRELRIQDMTGEILTGAGLYEVITYSFIGPKEYESLKVPMEQVVKNTVRILNPLGEDFSIMRTTLIPSMLEVIERNYSRKIDSAQFFELGKVYLPKDDPSGKLPLERKQLIIGMYGEYEYFDIKGTLELLFGNLGVGGYEFVRESGNTNFHPGKTAKILIGKKNAGIIGQVHPDLAQKFGVSSDIYICEIDFDIIIANARLDRHFKSLPKYPAVERDMALLVSKDIMASKIEDIIRKNGGSLVESIKLFDVYEGKQIPSDKKSVAYSIKYRAEDRTLTDAEVNEVHERILKAAEQILEAKLRL